MCGVRVTGGLALGMLVKFVLSARHLWADVSRKLNAGVLSSEEVQTEDKL